MEFGSSGPSDSHFHPAKNPTSDPASNFTFLSSQPSGSPPAGKSRPRRLVGKTAAFLQSLNIRPSLSHSRYKSGSSRDALRSPTGHPRKGPFHFSSQDSRKHSTKSSAEQSHSTKFLASEEEVSQLNSIMLKNIPATFLNSPTIRQHFGTFGSIKRVNCNPSKEYAIIRFANHEDAKLAKMHGLSAIPNCPPFIICWAKTAKKREVSSPEYQPEDLEEGEIPDEPPPPSKTPKRPHSQERLLRSKKVAGESREKLAVAQPIDIKSKNLEQWLTTQTNGFSDRCQVLMARDTLMRQKLDKQRNIYLDSIVVGTCPDMCPEFERYSRVEKNIISVFERKEGEVDPKAMVKEYSRSSADQREPLPHDLRPVPVLEQTMNHLLWNVVNRTDISPGEWYDFIWDRTRGIRKDMTLQHPCDLASVALIEKCARFHIHCGFALATEELSSFDPKINNDNLAECFQSLRQLYLDLALHGLKSPAEMEFRGYDILFNLTEGGVLRKIQDFSAEVQSSPEVKFAITVLQCITSNNYLRFFRLARSATYLSACLLHRYFSTVRLRAMLTMTKAYSRPNHPEMIPLVHLVDLLAFEDPTHTHNFCEHLGLQVEGNCVALDRSALNPSPSLYPVLLGYKMVASKRQASVGEIINGGPLSPNPYPTYAPHNSFDTEGKLQPTAFDASDQCRMDTTPPPPPTTSNSNTPPASPTIPAAPVQKPAPAFSFLPPSWPVAPPPTTALPTFSFLQARPPAPAVAEKPREFTWRNSSSQPLLFSVPQQAGQKKQEVPQVTLPSTRDQMKLGQEVVEEVVREEVASSVVQELFTQDCYTSLVKEVAREVCCQHIQEEQLYLQCSRLLLEELLGKMVDSECREFLILERFPLQYLAREVDQVISDLAHQYLAEVRAEQERRKYCHKHRLSRKYFSRWMWLVRQRRRRARALENFPVGPLFASSPTPRCPPQGHQLTHTHFESMQLYQANDQWLNASLQLKKQKDTYAALALPLEKMAPAGKVFKLLVLCPTPDHPAAEWVRAKFSCGGTPPVPHFLHRGPVEQLSLFKCAAFKGTHVSVQFVAGEVVPQEALWGTSGVFLLAQREDHVWWARHLISGLTPAPVLAIFHPGPHSQQPPDFCLTAQDLFEDTLEMARAFHWVVSQLPPPLPLKISPLRVLVQEAFSELVFGELASASPHIELEGIVALYNSVARYLAAVLASTSLPAITWPPPEVGLLSPSEGEEGIPQAGWNSPSRLSQLQEILLRLQVPVWREEDDPWGFVEALHSSCPQMDALLLRERVKQLLSKPAAAVPWRKMLEECFHVLMDTVSWKGPEGRPLYGHYLEHELASFKPPPEWNQAVRKALLFKKSPSPPPPPAPRVRTLPPQVTPRSWLTPLGIHYQNEMKVRLLSEQMEREKQKSQEYTALLLRLVEEGNQPLPSFPPQSPRVRRTLPSQATPMRSLTPLGIQYEMKERQLSEQMEQALQDSQEYTTFLRHLVEEGNQPPSP